MMLEEVNKKLRMEQARVISQETWCYLLYKHLKRRYRDDGLESARPIGNAKFEDKLNWLAELYADFYQECQKSKVAITSENSFIASEEKAAGLVFIPKQAYIEAMDNLYSPREEFKCTTSELVPSYLVVDFTRSRVGFVSTLQTSKFVEIPI